jgi:4-coumarate--CoA ligase
MPKFDLEKYLATVQRYRVSALSFVPPIAVLLAKSPVVKKYDLSSVKYVLAGGAPLGEKLANEAELAIDPSGSVKIRQAWGMCRLSHHTCSNSHAFVQAKAKLPWQRRGGPWMTHAPPA